MPAPLRPPWPPPVLAQRAGPAAAPATAPTAASFTPSAVLSRSPACEVGYRWQASPAACVGTCEAWPTRATGALAVPKAPLISFVSLPTRLATTSPVTSAIAITNAMAIAVAFHGFHVAFIPCLLDGVSQFASVWVDGATAVGMPARRVQKFKGFRSLAGGGGRGAGPRAALKWQESDALASAMRAIQLLRRIPLGHRLRASVVLPFRTDPS